MSLLDYQQVKISVTYAPNPIAVFMCISFSACSCDDDDSNGTANGLVTNEDGESIRVTSAGGYKYSYDDNGKFSYASYGSEVWTCSYSPFKITYGDSYDNEESAVYSVSQNGKGYITKLTGKYQWGNKEDGEKSSDTITFSYDSNGHLTKYVINSNGTYYDDSEAFSYSNAETCTLTWKDNKLIRLIEAYKEKEDGEDDYYRTVELSYDYNEDL